MDFIPLGSQVATCLEADHTVVSTHFYRNLPEPYDSLPPVQVSQSNAATGIDESKDLSIYFLSIYRHIRQRAVPAPVAIIEHVTCFVQSLLCGQALFHKKRHQVVVDP